MVSRQEFDIYFININYNLHTVHFSQIWHLCLICSTPSSVSLFWKEVDMTDFMVLSLHLPGEWEKPWKAQSEQSVTQSRFKLGTYQILLHQHAC